MNKAILFMFLRFALLFGIIYQYSWYMIILIYILLDYLIQKLFCLITELTKIPDGIGTVFTRIHVDTVILGFTKDKITNIEDISQQFLRNSENILIMRCVVVSYMNNLFLKRINGKELQHLWREAFIEVQEEIHSQQDICDFLMKEKDRNVIKNDQLQFKFYLIKDYSQKQSAFIFRINHGLADGISQFFLMNLLQDKYNINNQPFIAQKTLKYRIFSFFAMLLAPFAPLRGKMQIGKQSKLFDYDENENGLAMGKYYDLSQVKQASKNLNCTINDFLLTAVSQTFDRYGEHFELNDLNNMFATLIINFRKPNKSKDDIVFGNFVSGMPVTLKSPFTFKHITDQDNTSLRQSIQFHKQQTEEVKKSYFIEMNAQFYTILLYIMPVILFAKPKNEADSYETTRVLSNINGPPKPYQIGKTETEKMHFLGLGQNQMFNIHVLSHNNKLSFSVLTSKMNIDSRIFARLLEETIDDFILQSLK